MKRLFLAVDLNLAVVEKLARLQEEMVERIKSVEDVSLRPTNPANIHVTLKFLGDVETDLIPQLESKLTELVKPLFPFEVTCRGLGVFPKPSRPRILWAGLDEKGSEVMGLLQQAIEADFETLGFEPDERDYRPHVTLARVKGRGRVDLSEMIEEFSDLNFGSSYIRDIILYESSLRTEGAQYQVLNRFNLGEH